MNKLVIIGVAVAVILSTIALVSPGPAGKDGRDGNDGSLGVTSILTRNPLEWGGGKGIRFYASSMNVNQATTTLCSFLSPAASSTVNVAVKLDVASSSATIVAFGYATNPTATTTQIGVNNVVAASNQAFIVASSSAAAGGVPYIIPPSRYVNVSLQGGDKGAMGGLVPTGVCHASFEEYYTP